MSERKILDSGERREFNSGAVRDIQEGKGRCDLLPLEPVAKLLFGDSTERAKVLFNLDDYMRTGHTDYLYESLKEFILYTAYSTNPVVVENEESSLIGSLKSDPNWLKYSVILEVSKHYEEGAKKYAERNWEKGIPLHCFINSAIRHFIKLSRGDSDEPHDRAFVWNILGAIWTHTHFTQANNPEIFDLPFSKYVIKGENSNAVN